MIWCGVHRRKCRGYILCYSSEMCQHPNPGMLGFDMCAGPEDTPSKAGTYRLIRYEGTCAGVGTGFGDKDGGEAIVDGRVWFG